MSRIIDYEDRATCILFGDGAGAMLIEPALENEQALGFIDFIGEIDGSGGQYLRMPAGGSRMPASAETVKNKLHFVHQDGKQVFKYAVRKNAGGVQRAARAQRVQRFRSESADSTSGQ